MARNIGNSVFDRDGYDRDGYDQDDDLLMDRNSRYLTFFY